MIIARPPANTANQNVVPLALEPENAGFQLHSQQGTSIIRNARVQTLTRTPQFPQTAHYLRMSCRDQEMLMVLRTLTLHDV
jgi:hypothetical protein